MAEVVPDSDDQSLQHFLTHSTWDEGAVIDQIAHDADQLIGGKSDSCLLIDRPVIQKAEINPLEMLVNGAADLAKWITAKWAYLQF